jgi:hypothetical protein
VRRQAVAAGHPALARAAKATVQRILTQQALRPDKVTYYLERIKPFKNVTLAGPIETLRM